MLSAFLCHVLFVKAYIWYALHIAIHLSTVYAERGNNDQNIKYICTGRSIDPELKNQAESVLGQLGIPMSNAIGLFLRQVVLQQGIPG